MTRVALAILLVLGWIGQARAQVGSTSPGKLATAHAGFESQCNRCHVPFGGVPNAQCLSCHTSLAERVARGVGYHATVAGRKCIECHRDHDGRTGALSPAPPASFDHRVATFALEGKHTQLACDRCHPGAGSARRWVGIAGTCKDCHADRAHKGALGSDCAKCHSADGWTPATRSITDHQIAMTGGHAARTCSDCHASGRHLAAKQTCAHCHAQKHGGTTRECTTCHRVTTWQDTTYSHRVPLLPGKHQSAPCLACHPQFRFAAPPTQCASCHDRQRPHEPLGACSRCHSAVTWTEPTFDHDRSFPLTGKHMLIDCARCHTQPGVFRGAKRTCEGCHADPHGEQFRAQGKGCTDCHSTLRWRPTTITTETHATLGYPLREQHARATCKECHANGSFVGTQKQCTSCHVDKRHRGRLGTQCADCHDETAWWLVPRFDHALVGYRLDSGHSRVACKSCHPPPGDDGKRLVDGPVAQTPRECNGCHADTRHNGRFGTQCADCHEATAWWLVRRFDHARAGFALDGGHTGVDCKRCHGDDGKRLTGRAAPTACQTCHTARHGKQFGSGCTECHTTASFRTMPAFDHAARTGFPLERRHASLPCTQCHDATKRPRLNGDCRTCHGDPHRGSNSVDCAECHRADRWRMVRFDHDLTSYPLTGRHRTAACGGCHTNPNWTGVRGDCVACHALARPRDRKHQMETTCDDCHTTSSWRGIRR